MKLKDALQKLLSQADSSVFDWYDIQYIVFFLYKEKQIDGEAVFTKKPWPNQADVWRYVSQLLDNGFLMRTEPRKRKTSSFYLSAAKPHPFELVCYHQSAYISHLSAMITHGLTDRRSNTIWMTQSAASATDQKLRRVEHLQKLKKLTDLSTRELDQYVGPWHALKPEKINKRPIHYLSTRSFKNEYFTRAGEYQVATIGKTFLDMVEKPDFCGGIDHVIATYAEHSENYRRQLIYAADKFASKVAKCRVGYLLEEYSGIQDNKTLNKWAEQDAQRGGSRKLNPQAPYSPNYSERWCLSINID